MNKQKPTFDQLKKQIAETHYFTHLDNRLTMCVLVLDSGWMVTGISFCLDGNTYNEALHKEAAFHNAMDDLFEMNKMLIG